MANKLEPIIVTAGGEEVEYKRFPLGKIFKALALLKESVGEILDQIQKGLDPALTDQLFSLQSALTVEDNPEIRKEMNEEIKTLRKQIQENEISVTDITAKVIEKEEVAYELIQLAIDKDVEFIRDNVTLEEAVDIITVIFDQELSENFLAKMGKLKSKWIKQTVKSYEEESTPNLEVINGSGN